jgi:hypothetical protein
MLIPGRIDSLCIDQQNPVEKAMQVRNIMRVFEKAERVVGWLSDISLERPKQLDVRLNDPNIQHDKECLNGLLAMVDKVVHWSTNELWHRLV